MTGPNEDNIIRLQDGRRLGYADYGVPEGWPLLFFHGTPGSRVMARIAAAKAGELGVRLIAPERPGFGLSEAQPQRRLLDWANDVAELADALNLERFAIMGISGGGPYVAACAWQMPARLVAAGIVSGLAPVEKVRRELSWTHRLTGKLVSRTSLISIVMELLAGIARRRPEFLIQCLRLAATGGDRAILSRPEVRGVQIDGLTEALRPGVGGTVAELALLSRPWGFALEEIKVPVYLWHGEADVIVPVGMGRYVAEHISYCRARFIPKAGHLWIFQGYEEVLAALRGSRL